MNYSLWQDTFLPSQPCHGQFIYGWVGHERQLPQIVEGKSWERYRPTEGRPEVFTGWKRGN